MSPYREKLTVDPTTTKVVAEINYKKFLISLPMILVWAILIYEYSANINVVLINSGL